MKERGVLFSAPMVLAILNGSKTQTRRPVNPQPDAVADGLAIQFTPDDERLGRLGKIITCPYGGVSNRLWIREAWRADKQYDHLPPRDIPEGTPYFMEASRMYWSGGPHDGEPGKLRPSMFMPRWVSRITLEITEVRVERLQDISEVDALAEGIDDGWLVRHHVPPPRVLSYRALWEDLNGAGSWAANPFVWVVAFRRLP